MQAYHQHLTSLSLPNVNDATSNLLIASHPMNTMHEQQNQQSGQQHQQTTLSASYQNLVKPYLSNMANSCLINGALAQHKQQHYHQQQQQQQQSFLSPISAPSVASFVAKLLSLDKHQLQCLDTDHEIMTHINKAQTLMESRLQEINSKSSPMLSSGFDENGRRLNNQQQQQQQSLNMEALALHNQRQQAELVLHHQQQHQQPQQLLLQHNNYYNNLYAKHLALNQYAQLQHQQHQHQQQLMFLPTALFGGNNESSNLESSNNQFGIKPASSQQHQATSNLTVTASPLTSNRVNHQNNNSSSSHQARGEQANSSSLAPALDLRTTPTRLSLSATPSPIGSRNASTSSLGAGSRQSAPLPPKKMQSSEYKKMQQQQLAEHTRQLANSASSEHPSNTNSTNNSSSSSNNANNRQYEMAELNAGEICGNQNMNPAAVDKRPSAASAKRSHQELEGPTAANSRSSIRQQQQQQQQPVTKTHFGTLNGATGKRYKGEFDEPTPSEVSEREQQLKRPLYHASAMSRGECACVIGSQFLDRTQREAIEMLERWRSMKIEDRIKWKWAESDLPEDIPTSKIKEIEDLRSSFSQGRADFGGASKRKPLSIRGTRQFLLMLYCLWGHPGKEDVMQKEGYCPHCFAKIRSDNDQSTLVRVVNHFNMKHKRGANPRLSPHLDGRNSPQPTLPLPSPQSHQVVDILTRVVENAVAAVDEESDKDGRLQIVDGSSSTPTPDHTQADQSSTATESSEEQEPNRVKIEPIASNPMQDEPPSNEAGAQDQNSGATNAALSSQ